MKYLPRKIEELIKKFTRAFPVVALTGPRQSGKSTTLQNMFRDKYKYVSFDEYQNIDLFRNDPIKFFSSNKHHVIYDEVQKVPEMFNYIKVDVDNNRDKYGRFILTGSGNFLMMKNITESLAGRIGLLTLSPFQFSEIPAKNRYESIYRGSYPYQIAKNFKNWEYWYSAYIDSYLTKDLRNFSNIGDLRDFMRVLRMLAARTSQILNISELSRAIGIDVKTIKRWISILEASYIVFILEPYHKNFGKRITKSPKIYFYDTGIVSYLCGITNEQLFENGPMTGAIFENYIISEIIKNEHHTRKGKRFYYYRTSNGEEVDLIIEESGSISLIEIKNTETFRTKLIKTINNFPEKAKNSYLIYRGENLDLSKNPDIVNYKTYLGSI